MSSFLIILEGSKIAGYVHDVSKVDTNGMLVVTEAKDLEGLSLQQLTDMFNAWTGQSVGKFKIAKGQAVEKVFGVLSGLDLSTLVQLDKEEEAKIDDASKKIEGAPEGVAESNDQSTMTAEGAPEGEAPKPDAPAVTAAPEPTITGPKVRKVRDSKLQRMKAAFLMKEEDGSFKQWTVKELMEKCGTTERITHVYISILRSPTDRFRIGIDKNKETGTFVHTGLSTDPALQ